MNKSIMPKKNYYILIFLASLLIFFICRQSFALEVGLNYGNESGLGSQDIRVTIAGIVRTAMGILGIMGVVLIIISGFYFMISRGDPEQQAKAKRILISALIGLVIILAAYFLASFILNKLIEATGPQQPAGNEVPVNGIVTDNNENPNQPITYTCTGLAPTKATLCPDDDTGLTANTVRTAVASCTTETKCEYVCQLDFNIVDGNCVNGDPSLPSDYQGYYSFTTGANDLSSNHFDGTVTPDPSAIANGYLNLDGYHFVRIDSFSIGPSFTALARVKSDTEFWNDHGWIVSSEAANGFIIHPNAYNSSDNTWSGYIYDKSGNRYLYHQIGTYTPPAAIKISDWHTYGVEYDNDAKIAKMIFDGNVVVSKQISIDRGVSNSNIIIDIGHDIFTDTGRFGKGKIDWVYIYNRAVY